jgi:hypothetical protein
MYYEMMAWERITKVSSIKINTNFTTTFRGYIMAFRTNKRALISAIISTFLRGVIVFPVKNAIQ